MKLMGIELQDVGKKPEKPCEPENPPKMWYPTFYLGGDQVPEVLKDAEHDTEVILVARCRVSNVGTEDGEKGKTFSVNLEVQSLGCKPYSKKKVSEMTEEETVESLKGEEGYDREDED